MGRPHRSPEYHKRIPGVPILGKFRVRQDLPPIPPPQVDASQFSSDRYGGFGATVEVQHFPGEPDQINPEFRPDNDLLRPQARSRLSGGRGMLPAREQAVVLQTVSNRRRAQVAGAQLAADAPIVVPGPGTGAVPLSSSAERGGETFAAFETSGPVPGDEGDTFVPLEPAPMRRPTAGGYQPLPVARMPSTRPSAGYTPSPVAHVSEGGRTPTTRAPVASATMNTVTAIPKSSGGLAFLGL
jgi:hypothetical protein